MQINFTPAGGGSVTISGGQGGAGSPIQTVSSQNDKFLVRLDYTGTPVTTAAYVQLIAATPAALTGLEIFDSSGQTLVLAVGAPGSEVDLFDIVPGGNGQLPMATAIPVGSRLSVKAISATANQGELTVNYLS